MIPIKFKEQNITYSTKKKEYSSLPAFKANTPQGQVVSCWKLSIGERLRILFTGKLWVCIVSFNRPLTPTYFTTKKTDLLNSPEPLTLQQWSQSFDKACDKFLITLYDSICNNKLIAWMNRYQEGRRSKSQKDKLYIEHINKEKQGICIRCGCVDSRGCPDGCYWVWINRSTGRGLCSQCEPVDEIP